MPVGMLPRAIGLCAALLLGALAPKSAPADGEMRVDVELILAVDISYSMDVDELALQREGYAQALMSPEFLQAVRRGPNGKIAIAYVEWAGAYEQRTVMDWRLLDGPDTAASIAQTIASTPLRRAFRTSISGVINYAMPMFDGNGYRGLRRVIDISGDGANNQGELVTDARDRAVERGIVINGLPILLKRPNAATMDLEALDDYYEDCVIGGAGAFVVPVREREQFPEAIRKKLILEVAGLPPPSDLSIGTRHAASPARIVLAAGGDAPPAAPRSDCLIGERMWMNRMRN